MHATHPATAGNLPAPEAPHRRLRFTATLAALILAAGAIFCLAATGCNPERSIAAPGPGGDRDGQPQIAAFTIDDLPATLNLSDDQRTRLTAAIADLREARQAVGRHMKAAGRGHGRGPGARMHRGRGPGAGEGLPAGFEPPMIGFLEKASTILNGDQFVILAQFLAARRAEMRPGAGTPPPPFDGPFGRLAARRLGLTDTQKEQLKPLITAYGEGMRQVHEGITANTLTPEQARDRAKELRLTLEQGAQGILTPDQWKQVQTFRETRHGRQSGRGEEALPRQVDRLTGMYVRILGLDDSQAAKVRQIMEGTIPARRALLERRAQGGIEPEDFLYEMMTIEKNAADQVRAVLTPDQAQRFDALRSLLPRGPHLGGPMGGPAGGRRGWHGGRR